MYLSSGKDSHPLPITNHCLEILEIIENLCSSFEEHLYLTVNDFLCHLYNNYSRILGCLRKC